MKIDSKELFSAFPHLAKNPSFSVTVIALLVPIVLLFSASKFASASIEALIIFGILGVSTLLYSGWIIFFINRKYDDNSK